MLRSFSTVLASPAGRLGAAYAFLFLGLGASLPFLPRWLESQGLSGEQVGLALGLGMVARFIAAPLGGRLADRLGRPRRVLAAAGLATALGYLAMALAPSPALIIALAIVTAGAAAPLAPILDSLAVAAEREGEATYGVVRSVGSAAFVVANIVLGLLIGQLGPEAIIVWLILGCAIFARVVLMAPRAKEVRAAPAGGASLSSLATPATLCAFAASALTQGSHAFYYGFSVLTWRDAGWSDATIGFLWAWGVVAEIAFLLFGTGVARRLGPWRLAFLGAVAGVVRWSALAFAPGLLATVALQVLHGGTFAVAHMAFIRYAHARVPAEAAATAQTLNSALTLGGVLAGATALSGFLYARYGAGGYLAMAMIAGLGLFAALAQGYFMRRRPTDPAEPGA